MAGKTFAVNNVAAAAVTFNPTISLKDGQQYADSATTLQAPRFAVVKHTIAGSSSNQAVDRHFLAFSKTVYDTNGKGFTAQVGVSFTVPRTQVSSADLADLRAFAKNFLADDAKCNALLLGDY